MTLYDQFLETAGWTGAKITPLAGDASNRRYSRAALQGRTAVLMDAPPSRGEDTAPFLKIAAFLRRAGLHAPEVFASDPVAGLVLLEDLGDGLFARRIEQEPALQAPLYDGATDVLLQLHDAGLPEGPLPDYMPPEMAEAATLAATWYAQDADAAEPLRAAVAQSLDALDWSRPVLVLRDYHAENLIWIDAETGLNRIGLLDFQDAARGHPVYDVVSLMQDARRDVPPETARRVATRFCDRSGMEADTFARAAATLGAQRALRILGVFARLSLHYAKPGYIDLIPRVWDQLTENLTHPALAGLRETAAQSLPAPTPDLLSDLRQRAGTCPTR